MTTKVNVIVAETGTQNANLMATLNLLNAGMGNVGGFPVGPELFVVPSMAVAVFLEMDFAKSQRRVDLLLELLDQDGHPAVAPGTRPIEDRRIVRPQPTLGPAGTPVRANVLFVMQGVPLKPDTVYRWRVTVDRETKEEWEARFYAAPLDTLPDPRGSGEAPSDGG